MRPICPRCQRPLPACLCAWVRPTANRLPLLVLQHPQEAGHAKGSVRLLQCSLADCTVQVGEHFSAEALGAWLGPAGSSLLLYPDKTDALPATGRPGAPAIAARPLPTPDRLVLLDGTWRQARGLLRAHPLLQALPRWALPDVPPPRYAIRRAHQPAQRSTLEAACAALGLLEDRPVHYAPLLDAFSAWVAQLAARAEAGRGLSAARPRAGS
ncbi:MAG: DTW domain-containing protein [Aquabacterium sp.]|nr:DTW domain-containing protein [Aquabacterium sp.]